MNKNTKKKIRFKFKDYKEPKFCELKMHNDNTYLFIKLLYISVLDGLLLAATPKHLGA